MISQISGRLLAVRGMMPPTGETGVQISVIWPVRHGTINWTCLIWRVRHETALGMSGIMPGTSAIMWPDCAILPLNSVTGLPRSLIRGTGADLQIGFSVQNLLAMRRHPTERPHFRIAAQVHRRGQRPNAIAGQHWQTGTSVPGSVGSPKPIATPHPATEPQGCPNAPMRNLTGQAPALTAKYQR
ncbi:hypothetical protein [Chromatocurvus halotolerans]|uniref:hypothetical protein n=1 Tax=Chromatocurvus halotolerans TaxID=1132028 RepID=UPI001F0C6CCA|nr:hypothetical protein [Chromatocurvus halotolerans]